MSEHHRFNCRNYIEGVFLKFLSLKLNFEVSVLVLRMLENIF